MLRHSGADALMVGRAAQAEAVVAEFSPAHQRGRYVGLFQTLVSFTFIAGPAALVWAGPQSPATLWWVMGLSATGLAGIAKGVRELRRAFDIRQHERLHDELFIA